MAKQFKCSCGRKVSAIKYIDGKKVCDACNPSNSLSGAFLRRVEGDRQEYAKDILQPYNKDGSVNKDYIDAYGETKQKKR